MEVVLKGLWYIGDEWCVQWFVQFYDYVWLWFFDLEYGEWFGYLKWDGMLLYIVKGGKWKGCFYVLCVLWGCLEVLKKLLV